MESFKRTSFVLLGVIFLYLFILLVDTTASTVIFCFVIMIMCYVYARGYSQKIQNIQTHLGSAISQVQFLSSHPSQLDNIKLSLCNNEAIGTCSSAFFSQVFRASNIGWQVPGLIANNEQLVSLRSPRDFFTEDEICSIKYNTGFFPFDPEHPDWSWHPRNVHRLGIRHIASRSRANYAVSGKWPCRSCFPFERSRSSFLHFHRRPHLLPHLHEISARARTNAFHPDHHAQPDPGSGDHSHLQRDASLRHRRQCEAPARLL